MTKNTDTGIASSPPSFMQKVEAAADKVAKAEERELTAQELDDLQIRQATIEKATTRLKQQAEYLLKIETHLKAHLPLFIALNPLGKALDGFIELEAQVKEVEAGYDAIAKIIAFAREVSWPTRLDTEDTRTVTSKDTGARVTRSTKVYASIVSDPTGNTLERAYAWLRKPVFFEPLTEEQKKMQEAGEEFLRTPLHPWTYDHTGGLVLRDGVNDDDQPNYGPIIKETVNSSSLSSLMKEILEMGREPPEDLFKVYSKDGVSITKGKTKK